MMDGHPKISSVLSKCAHIFDSCRAGKHWDHVQTLGIHLVQGAMREACNTCL